jgi:flap endonuclease-1
MGIKGLPKLIQEIAGSAAIRTYNFSKFRGWTISVDANLMIHQTVIALRSSGRDMKNSRGELTSHLHGLFYKILIFLQNEIVPIFVFDGKSPDIKNKTIARRWIKKKHAEKILQENDDLSDEEYIKNFKQTFTLTKENIREAQILLDLMGIPYIIAPGEADVVCTWLAARYDENGKRYVKGVCSEDSDMLALGAPYLFKDMLHFMSKNKPVRIISLHKALVNMNLTMKQFVDLCVLLGTDYCDNVKGIGPKKAYNLIIRYNNLEGVFQYLYKNGTLSKKNEDHEYNIKCMFEARNYFLNALDYLDQSDNFVITDEQLKLKKCQYEELMDFMCVKHNFDVVRIHNGIKRLEEYHKKMGVTRENTKKVHMILQPRTENYIFASYIDNIDFLPSDDERKLVVSKKDSVDTIDNIISKKKS